MSAYRSFIPHHPKLESTIVSFNHWTDKQTVGSVSIQWNTGQQWRTLIEWCRHARTLKCVLGSERGQTQEATHHTVLFLWSSGKDKTEGKKWLLGIVLEKRGWWLRAPGVIFRWETESFWMEPWWWVHDSMHLANPVKKYITKSELYCIQIKQTKNNEAIGSPRMECSVWQVNLTI